MKEKYPVQYERAIDASKKKNLDDREIQFDERSYSSKDISEFFKDLMFADLRIYELVVHKLANKKGGLPSFNKQAKEFKVWKKEFLELTKA
jgi:hypothetical protein